MPGSPDSQQNPQGGKDSQAGPGPDNVTQSGLRICPQDQCCKESMAEPRRRKTRGASLEVQWLRLHALRAGGLGLVPGQGTRCHMPH